MVMERPDMPSFGWKAKGNNTWMTNRVATCVYEARAIAHMWLTAGTGHIFLRADNCNNHLTNCLLMWHPRSLTYLFPEVVCCCHNCRDVEQRLTHAPVGHDSSR